MQFIDFPSIIPCKVNGDAFGFSNRSKYVVCGGDKTSNLVKIDEIDNQPIVVSNLKEPLKYVVSSYEWHPSENYKLKYIQNRNKFIELVDVETKSTYLFNGHTGFVNESKWSPSNTSIFASCANDSYVYIWDIDLDKPVLKEHLIEHSIGGAHCLAWSRTQDHTFALTCNNDVKIYDIRKLNSICQYFPNAHTKRITSIDWAWNEDKFIVCGNDKSVRMWYFNSNLNSNDDKTSLIKTDDFHCWKAKFIPHSSNIVILPTCQSATNVHKNALNTSIRKQQQPQLSPTTATTPLLTQQLETQNNFKLAVCQYNSSNQYKIFKYSSSRTDMILNFEFESNEEHNVVAWTKDQNIISFSLDSQYMTAKDALLSKSDDTTDLPMRIQPSSSNLLPLTTTSSRKSSFSEFGGGTPPNSNSIGLHSLIYNPLLLNPQFSESQSKSNSRIAEIIPYPKCFCAKFSGLPQHLIVFQNKNKNQYKTYPKQYEQPNEKFNDRRFKNKPVIKPQKSRVKLTDKKSRVYIIDMSDIISIRYDAAVKYTTSALSLDNKRLNIEKNNNNNKVWDIIQAVTLAKSESVSLNPDHGRPWSCSAFGRPLVQDLIQECLKVSDIQSAVLIITKLLKYDKNLVPNPSTLIRKKSNDILTESSSVSRFNNESTYVSANENPLYPIVDEGEKLYDASLANHIRNIGILDPDESCHYDFLIKFYCEILNKWGLYIERAELFDFICDKPLDLESKLEFQNLCKKCHNRTSSPKCYNSNCRSFLQYCSLCQLPVNGLQVTCFICGHGGHYEHMVEWFKKQEDCAAACGCKCNDFI